MAATPPGNGIYARLEALDDRIAQNRVQISRLYDRTEGIGALQQQVSDLRGRVDRLAAEVSGLRRNLVLFSLSFIGIAFTILIAVVAVIVQLR